MVCAAGSGAAKETSSAYSLDGADGVLVVTTDPDDEVAKAGPTLEAFFGVGAIILGLWMLVIRYISFASDLWNVFTLPLRMGPRRKGRAPVFGTPELARINRKFNEMADALEQAGGENRLLTQRLIKLRDEERRVIARELHDNLAQYVC